MTCYLRSRLVAALPQIIEFMIFELVATHLFCMAGASGGEWPSRLNNVPSITNSSRHAQGADLLW